MAVNLTQNRDQSLNLTFKAGETVGLTFSLTNDDGTAMDLTGHSFRAPIKHKWGTQAAAGEFTASIPAPATAGVLTLVLAATDSATMSPGNYTCDIVDDDGANLDVICSIAIRVSK